MKMKSLLTRMVTVIACLMASLYGQAGENRFYVYNAANGLADNSAQTIICTKTGRLVITTMGQINFFDGNNFTFIDPSKENTYPLPNYRGNYHLYFDRYHHLWLKDRHSVTCVDLMTERFTNSIEKVFKEFGCDEEVADMFVDQMNVVWLLTKRGLFNVETKQVYPVRSGLNLQDMEFCQERYLLLFYDNGLLEMTDLEAGKKIYSGQPYGDVEAKNYSGTSLQKTIGNTIFQIRNGSNSGILLRFDIEKQAWKTLLKTPYYLSNLAEKDSILYIPSAYGYWTYDMRSEKMEHVEELDMANGGKLLTDINAMEFDKQGGMWVGTEKRGLLYARPQVTPFKVYTWDKPHALELAAILDRLPEPQTTYRGRPCNCVYRDSRGWEWVGTSTGLQLYRSESDQLPHIYTRSDGLLNNVIHTIIEDDLHNIWVGTSFGICCLLFDNNKLRYINSYSQWDNVPSESFVNGRVLRLSGGNIAMQMLDHVIEFNPRQMATVSRGFNYQIYPKLIRLMVNGNNLHTGEELDGEVILDKALSRTKEINLSYNQNSVTLTFSAMNYFRPQQTFYRVRVNGLDNTWHVLTSYNSGGRVDSRGMLHLPMVALKPGSYKIELQTSMIPDEWTTEPYEWIVNVNEPWWRTTGVQALFGVVLLLLIAINTYYYMKNVSMRAARNSQEQGVLRQIRSFAEHCSSKGKVLLEPVPDEHLAYESTMNSSLTPEFIVTMQKIMPTVLDHELEQLSMRDLSAEAGMELQPFYQVILGNIFKNPRPLAKKLMLQRAEDMLKRTEKDMEEVAAECGFVTPNFFIATFYHEHKMTPEVYRRQYSRLRQRQS
jgi:AraC-like DNA-binding protein